MATLRVISRSPVVVGTWVRGEVFSLRSGDSISVNPSGIPMYKGKVLNLPAEVQRKLVVARRVVVEG